MFGGLHYAAALVLLLLGALVSAAHFDPKNPRVEDRLAIADFMTRYCTAVDTRDFDEFRSLFTEDAVLDYTENLGSSKAGVKRIAKELSDSLTLFSVSVHQWSNLDIHFTGPNEAKIRVLLDNPMYIHGFPMFKLFNIYGYYNHDMVKGEDGVWRSKGMRMEVVSRWEHQLLGVIAIIILLYRTRRILQ